MTLAKFSGVANGANIFSKLRDTLMDSLKNISILILPFVQLWRTFIYVYIFEQHLLFDNSAEKLLLWENFKVFTKKGQNV